MAPKANLNLSDDQRFALMKFRRSVSDVCTLPYHDDQFLLRWLRARNWDPEAAESMLRASLKWRAKWEVDSLNSWTPPKALEQYYPSGLCGFDEDGAPVIIVPFAGLDIWGMLHSVTKEEFIKYTAKIAEGHLELARAQSKKHGVHASQLVAIIDMTDFNLKSYAWKPAGELVISLLQMYDANYPEILKACYIINVPKVFALAFSIVKGFLNEYTISKIHIYKSDRSKWEPVLLATIPKDQLPAHYGGSMTDPDGDPKCPSKVKQGGKVPKSMYSKNQVEKLVTGKESYTPITIKKGEKLCLEFLTPEKGYFLKWGFYSDDHDIKFGVLSKDLEGNETTVVPVHRVACHQNEEVGIITCPEPATYKLVFDNSYSFLRSKKLHYSVTVAPPVIASTEPQSTRELQIEE